MLRACWRMLARAARVLARAARVLARAGACWRVLARVLRACWRVLARVLRACWRVLLVFVVRGQCEVWATQASGGERMAACVWRQGRRRCGLLTTKCGHTAPKLAPPLDVARMNSMLCSMEPGAAAAAAAKRPR